MRNLIAVVSLLALVAGASGPRLWVGIAAWLVCAAIERFSDDPAAASIGAWSSAVVALVVLS